MIGERYPMQSNLYSLFRFQIFCIVFPWHDRALTCMIHCPFWQVPSLGNLFVLFLLHFLPQHNFAPKLLNSHQLLTFYVYNSLYLFFFVPIFSDFICRKLYYP